MTPEENLVKEIKEWRDACKEAHEEGLKKDVYELGFHLTYLQLDKLIRDYEKSITPEVEK